MTGTLPHSMAQVAQVLLLLALFTGIICEGIDDRTLNQEALEGLAPIDGEYVFDYEWEGYDGWYNNPAHPEWGGAGT